MAIFPKLLTWIRVSMERKFRGTPWPISPSKGLWNISIGNSNLNEVEFEIIK